MLLRLTNKRVKQIKINTQQRSVGVCTCCLSHVPGLRTCLPVKISNIEAHAEMYIAFSTWRIAYRQIPRTSTVTPSNTGFPSVRSLERKDEALSKRLLLCSDFRSHPAASVSYALTHRVVSPPSARRRLSRPTCSDGHVRR